MIENRLLDAALLPPRAEKIYGRKSVHFDQSEKETILPLISESEPRRPALRLRRASRFL